MRSSFQAKQINDSIFIEELVMWRHYIVILEKQRCYIHITLVAW